MSPFFIPQQYLNTKKLQLSRKSLEMIWEKFPPIKKPRGDYPRDLSFHFNLVSKLF